jgi:hypothetical protein
MAVEVQMHGRGHALAKLRDLFGYAVRRQHAARQ